MRFYKIPIFLPNKACPNKCIFCNQYSIASKEHIPEPDELPPIFEKHFNTFKSTERTVEIAYFGGNFTGIEEDSQKQYLDVAKEYLNNGQIDGIRISTRPDYINKDKLALLKSYGVTAIELGTQTLDDKVLKLCNRNHTAEDSVKAAKLIKDYGFELGMQMMTGLPGDTEEKSIKTAKQIIDLGAQTTRIYPCLVIKDTELANLYEKGEYSPQLLESAIKLSATLVELFENANVKVLRVGLHPSEGFIRGEELIDGPFHPAFGELVRSVIWFNKFKDSKLPESDCISIRVNPKSFNVAIGHCACNKEWLKKKYSKVIFKTDSDIGLNEFYADSC